MIDFHASLDATSLQKLVRLQGFSALLDPAITQGLTQSGQLLVGAAQAKTWSVFANPSGTLAGSIYFYVTSPSEVAVAVGVPYGARREYGFSGQTDVLGRFYANDPARPYLDPTLNENQAQVAVLMEVAVNGALGRVVA